MSRSRRHRGWRSAAALAASVLVLGGLAGSAQASTVTVAPTNPSPGAGNNFPFGQATIWVPFAGFVYKNVPAFDLKTGDKLGFDLIAQNTTNIQLQVDLAATTTNGGDVPAGPFTTIVNNSNLPENPKGDTTPGNYELRFVAQTPFNFPGGGLVIRFSSPGGAFASDAAGENVLGSRGTSADPSNQFVERFFTDANGAAPWTNASPGEIGGFQLTLADAPQGGGNGNNAAPKKCKKKKHHRSASAAKKKCKKKKHH